MANYEEEEDWLAEGVAALAGGAHEAPSTAVSELLMGLLMNTAQLIVLLQESDESEYALCSKRLKAWLKLIEQIPQQPRPRKVIGFKVSGKRRAGKRLRRQVKSRQ